MGIFDDMQEKMAESQARWNDINEVSEQLKKAMENGHADNDETILLSTATLVLLLAEQLRPMGSSEGQMEDVQEAFTKVFEGLAKKK